MLKRNVQATLSVLGGALKMAANLLMQVRAAYHRDKELQGILGRHDSQIRDTISMLESVERGSSLKTPAVKTQLEKMRHMAAHLLDCLQKSNTSSKSPRLRVFHQLMHGARDEQLLSRLVGEIANEKTNMMLHLQIAGAEQVKALGGNRNTTQSSRIIANNWTRAQAFQINGAAGLDSWASVSQVEIQDNVAGHGGTQLNGSFSEAQVHTALAAHVLKAVFVLALFYVSLAYLGRW